MPVIQEIHINQPLTNLSIAFRQEGAIGRELFPVVKVKKESDIFYKYGKEGMKLYNGLRAPGAESKEIYWTVTTDTYSCQEQSFHHAIPDRVRNNMDDPLDADRDTTIFLTDVVITQEEKDAYDVAFASLDAVGYKGTPSTLWDTNTNTDPVGDVESAKEEIRKKIFKSPNLMVIPQAVFNKLKTNSQIVNYVKYTQKPVVTVELLSSLFGIRVVVAYAGYIDDDDAHNYIWDKDCFLAYITSTPGLRIISFGYTFSTVDKEVRKWREPKRKSDIIETSGIFDHKVVCQDAGYMLENVIS